MRKYKIKMIEKSTGKIVETFGPDDSDITKKAVEIFKSMVKHLNIPDKYDYVVEEVKPQRVKKYYVERTLGDTHLLCGGHYTEEEAKAYMEHLKYIDMSNGNKYDSYTIMIGVEEKYV